MKKLVAVLMAVVMMMSVVACGKGTEGENGATDGKFELKYTEYMESQGYETLVLDKVPERIVCTVTAPVLTLHEMGASLIAIPKSAATTHIAKENSDITVLASIMSDDFNIENVVALSPDLVILNSSYADSYGKTLADLGITVYYVAAGHGTSYETVKEESMCFIEAFSVDEESKTKASGLKEKFAVKEAWETHRPKQLCTCVQS